MQVSNTIFGFHAVVSGLKTASKGAVLWVGEGREDERMRQCLAEAELNSVTVKYTNKKQLQKMSEGGNHQGVVLQQQTEKKAQDEKDFFAFLDDVIAKPDYQPFFLVLDGVTDPHNLGACMRTANGAGVDAVIVPKDKSAGLTPVVVKVASGAVDSTPFFQVTNLARVLRHMADKGIWLVGLDDKSEDSMYNVDCTEAIVMVLGNEGSGIRRLTKEICQQLVTIPMEGAVSSLNVSVATGVILYEVVRQRRDALSIQKT